MSLSSGPQALSALARCALPTQRLLRSVVVSSSPSSLLVSTRRGLLSYTTFCSPVSSTPSSSRPLSTQAAKPANASSLTASPKHDIVSSTRAAGLFVSARHAALTGIQFEPEDIISVKMREMNGKYYAQWLRAQTPPLVPASIQGLKLPPVLLTLTLKEANRIARQHFYRSHVYLIKVEDTQEQIPVLVQNVTKHPGTVLSAFFLLLPFWHASHRLICFLTLSL